VHDTAAHLAACIESVLAQDYGCFEYVIVENWSRDGSGEIARRYAAADRRLRVVSPPQFLSQVSNYNFALRQLAPESRYVKLVQADDSLFPQCLSAMVSLAEQHPSVGIVSAYCLRDSGRGTEVLNQGLPYPTSFLSGREVCRRHLLEDIFLFGTPTQLLYRAEVVRARDPFFDERALHEDTEACYEILRQWDFGFVHQVLSYWRWREESISGRAAAFNPNPLDRYIVTMKYGREFLDEHELAGAARRAERVYYSGLATAAAGRRGQAFWAYHRHGLERAGLRLSRLKLLKHLALHLCELALDPWTTLGRLQRRWRGQRR
jgi:glycosyltransferase involved in cell wall biosynthesis